MFYAGAVNSQRLLLVLAGAGAVAAIAFTMILAHKASVPAPVLLAMLLGTYAAGLGIGGLALKRGG